jgi:hypothetical protein
MGRIDRNICLTAMRKLHEGVALEHGNAQQSAVGAKEFDDLISAHFRIQIAHKDSGSEFYQRGNNKFSKLNQIKSTLAKLGPWNWSHN